ncbi:hypothetical protein [Endozoicomonas lisbonensis]|uniref:DUF4149 domain-containing protein n=1 Tax=Endozoicomonas lisbonensis TaxID=3120522 RepID=A0ABV2SHV3_9GAMM
MLKPLALFLVLIWSGMILGISFLEAPVKFHAPSLTLATGVDVGRHVFGVFEKVQWVFLVILAGILFGLPLTKAILCAAALIALCQLVQTLWLLPILNSRAEQIISGQPVLPSNSHTGFAITELLKLFALLWLAWMVYKSP